MLISSLANPSVKQLRSLHAHKGRTASSLFLAEGPHLVEEALAAEAAIPFCLLSDEWPGKWQLAGKAADRHVPCYFGTARVMQHVATTESACQAVAAVAMWSVDVARLRLPHPPLVAMLHGIQDPGNLGTIIRTAAAADASAVVTSGPCADFFNPKVVRATAGALFRIPLARAEDPAQFLSDCARHGSHAFAAVAQGGVSHRALNYRDGAIFVFGSEAHGLPSDVLRACQDQVTVQMAPGVDSLNVAVCAAILLFEARAQITALPAATGV